jgi:LPS-assembly lipoprotein
MRPSPRGDRPLTSGNSRGPVSRRAALVAVLAVPGLLAGCGFEPIYATDEPAAAMRGRIAVDPIDGAAGFALQERLTDRLGAPGPAAHRLVVDLDLRQQGAAITQDNITTRFQVIGSASFDLFAPGGAAPVLSESVGAQTGFSAPAGDVASAFASRAAGIDANLRLARDLADRIVMRLALTADRWAADAATPPAGP